MNRSEEVDAMRCDDVCRELAAPTGSVDPDALARHLATCSPCADIADEAGRFDAIWDQTRPDEPSDEAFDAIWAGVTHAVDAPAVLPMRRNALTRKRFPILGIVAIAQAAALLVAVGLLLRPHGGDESRPSTTVASAGSSASRDPVWDIGVGQTLILELHEEGDDHQIVCHPRPAETAELFALGSDPDVGLASLASETALDMEFLTGMESIQ